jgi:hypothetical protein
MVVAGFALRPERPVLEALSEDQEAEYEESLNQTEGVVSLPSYISSR